MRFLSRLMALSTTLLLGSAPATLAAQASVQVQVATADSHAAWYTDPAWLWLGGFFAVMVILLAIMAARREPRTTTTVIR